MTEVPPASYDRERWSRRLEKKDMGRRREGRKEEVAAKERKHLFASLTLTPCSPL